MATVTAQFLIGTSHPYHDGICPTHQIFLYENSRPCLQLFDLNKPEPLYTWIPTVDTMIHDAMLMITACILKNADINKELATYFPNGFTHVDSMFSVPEQARKRLYKTCQKQAVARDVKVVLTMLNDSSLLRQYRKLASYDLNTELCVSKTSKSPLV